MANVSFRAKHWFTVFFLLTVFFVGWIFLKEDTKQASLSSNQPASAINESKEDFSQTGESVTQPTKAVISSGSRIQSKQASASNLLAHSDEFEKKYGGLSSREIVVLLATKLSAVERDYLENLLAQTRGREIDRMLEEMIDDGFMDLSLTGEELPKNEAEGFKEAATNRLNSAIRVMGLRGNSTTVGTIIDIASHYNAEESTVRASYEALGYLGTSQGVAFLSSELNTQKNPFLKSEIVLSLTTAGSSSNIDRYLSYLNSSHTDLRNSAIVALGAAKEERAVAPFSKMFSEAHYSSKILIVQALGKINSGSARDLLNEISKNYPDLVPSSSQSEDSEEGC